MTALLPLSNHILPHHHHFYLSLLHFHPLPVISFILAGVPQSFALLFPSLPPPHPPSVDVPRSGPHTPTGAESCRDSGLVILLMVSCLTPPPCVSSWISTEPGVPLAKFSFFLHLLFFLFHDDIPAFHIHWDSIYGNGKVFDIKHLLRN